MQTRWRWVVPLATFTIGLLIATTAALAHGTDLRAERRTDLADLIVAEDGRVDEASARVDDLRQQVETLSASQTSAELRQLESAAERLAPAAGLGAVEGSGLSVRLEDAPVPAGGIPESYAPDDYVVHSQDLQSVINALWAGGAEAMQVMDQRLVSTSAVRCVGNTLILQGRVYSPPYTVTGVGPPERMRRALENSPGVALYRQYAALIGLGYAVDEHSSATVVGYEGALQLQHAQAGP